MGSPPRLANELLHQILSNLECADLFLCSQVSNSFYEIASALRFRSIIVRCDLETEGSSEELPSKAKTEHAHLEALETDVSLAKFVKQLRFDMAYCLHALGVYEHSIRMEMGVKVVNFLVKSAWAELQHTINVEELVICLYEFDNKEFTADLFRYASTNFPFWHKLRHLQIENSTYGNVWGWPDGRVVVGESRLSVQRFVALAPNLRSLSLGDVDVELLADNLPRPAKLSNLKQLDISLTRAPELVLHATSSNLIRWISLYRYQLTSLTLRLLEDHYSEEHEDTIAQLEELRNHSPIVLPFLSHLKLDPIFRPDLLASTLAILAPKLAHLYIIIARNSRNCRPDTSLYLSALHTIGITSSYATLLPVFDCFASVAPNLKYLQAFSSDGGEQDTILGVGEHCWCTGASNADPSIKCKVMRLSIRWRKQFSAALLDELLSSYSSPLDLHLQFLGLDGKTKTSNHCEGCSALLGPSYSWSDEAVIQQQSEELVQDCDRAFASLRAADLFGCCIKVDGNGELQLDCKRCVVLEKTGAMHAVREVCAYRGKREGAVVIGQT